VVHFCCGDCVGKYLAKEKLKAEDKGPKDCPDHGKPATKDASLDVNGEMLYFCCGKCRAAS